MRINITTMLGKSRTNPSGIDIVELPFSRIRRRKKDNLEDGLEGFSSYLGAGDVYGKLLSSCWKRPGPLAGFQLIAAVLREESLQRVGRG